MNQDIDREAGWFFPQGCIVGAVIPFLAFILMLGTMKLPRHNDAFACFGGLGAGFPVSFLCDYSGGGSPLSSAGKIDWADFPYFSPQGTLVDVLFYSIQLGMIWSVGNNILQKKYEQAALVVLLYLVGFLSAVLLFHFPNVRIERSFPVTPTPLASPTTIGTDAPPATPNVGP